MKAKDVTGNQEHTSNAPANNITNRMANIIDQSNEGFFVNTGFKEVDAVLGPIKPGELVIIGARPAIGKTTVMIQAMDYMASSGASVALFENEMSCTEVCIRLLSKNSHVPAEAIRTKMLSGEKMEDAVYASNEISKSKIILNEACFDVENIIETCEELCESEAGLDVAFIDSLQSLRLRNNKYTNRYEELAEITRLLKRLATDCGIVVFASSQLSRNVNMRRNYIPILKDLSDCGGIEQIADIVILLNRLNYYTSEEECANIDIDRFSYDMTIDMKIAKNRYGSEGSTFSFFWIPRICKIGSSAPIE